MKSRIDHVVVYEQGAQVERLAEVALNEGIHMLVFHDLHTAIDPSRIRLTGKGGFTVLGISTDTTPTPWAGPKRNARAHASETLRNSPASRTFNTPKQDVLFDREEQLLLQNQDFKVKDTGVDLQRLMEATAFYSALPSASTKDAPTSTAASPTIRSEIAAVDAAMQHPCPPCAPPPRWKSGACGCASQSEGALVFQLLDATGRLDAELQRSRARRRRPNATGMPSHGDPKHRRGVEDVSLTVATGSPSQNRTKPELQPWYIDGSAGKRPTHAGAPRPTHG